MAFELFKMYGTIFLKSDKADKTLDRINRKAKKSTTIFDGMGKAALKLGGVLATTFAAGKLINLGQEAIELANDQIEAETKLRTVYKERLNATDEQIKSIMELTAAQQNLGVVGDEVQLAGAQQVATFLKSADSVETLIPAMNNLLVQQKGLNATQSDATNIANMFGKVLDGQTGALSRVGISFTEAQKEILKTGTEMERASTLAEIITANVGNMNEAFAETDAGRIQQVRNRIGDLKEEIGRKLLPIVEKFYSFIGRKLLPIFENLVKKIGGDMSPTLDKLKRRFFEIVEAIKKDLAPTFDNIRKNVIPPLIELFKGMKDKYIPALLNVVKAVFPVVKTIILDVVNAIVIYILPPLLKYLKLLYTEVFPKILAIVVKVMPMVSKQWEIMWKIIEPILWVLKKTFDIVFPHIASVAKITVQAIGIVFDVLIKAFEKVYNFINRIFKNGWEKSFIDIKGIFIDIFDSIVEYFEGVPEKMLKIGELIFESIGKGIEKGKEYVKGKVKGAGKVITDGFKSFFKIASPSKTMMEIGKNIVEGVAEGIKRNINQAVERMDDLGNAITEALRNKHQKRQNMREKFFRREHEKLIEKYAKNLKLAEQNNDKQTRLVELGSRLRIKKYEKEYQAKFKLLDEETKANILAFNKQIAAIDKLTELEEKQLDEQDYNKRLQAKKDSLLNVEKAEEREKILEDIALMEKEKARENLLEQREIEKDSLRLKIEQEEEASNKLREEMEKELKTKKHNITIERDMLLTHYKNEIESTRKHYENLNSAAEINLNDRLQKEKENFDKLLKEEKLNAEARKLIIDGNQKKIVRLLNKYNSDWETAGQSFGESLLDGLNKTKRRIENTVNEMMREVSRANNLKTSTGQQKKLVEELNTKFGAMGGTAKIENNQVTFSALAPPPLMENGKAAVNVNINNPSIMGDDDADKFGTMLTNKLRALGVNP